MEDFEKKTAAVAKALDLEEGAGIEEIVKLLQAMLAFEQATKSEAPPEEPAEEAAASNAPEDTVSATAEPSEDAKVVEASDEPADSVELMEDGETTDPAAGEAKAVVGMLVELTGMDEASVLAALREQAEAVAGLLSGQPDDGMPAEDPETGMSRETDRAALEASRANTKAAQAKLAKAIAEQKKLSDRIAELEADSRKARVQAAIDRGDIAPGSAKPYLALARTGGKDFEDLMAEAAASPEVPTGTIAAGKGSNTEADDHVSPDTLDLHPDVIDLTRKLGRLANSKSGQREINALKGRLTNHEASA